MELCVKRGRWERKNGRNAVESPVPSIADVQEESVLDQDLELCAHGGLKALDTAKRRARTCDVVLDCPLPRRLGHVPSTRRMDL